MYGIVPGLSSSQDSMGMQNSATEPRSLVGSKSRSFTKHKGRKVVDNSSKGHSFTTPTPIITSVVGISSNSYTNSSHNNNNNNNNTHTNTHNNNVMTSKTTSSIPKYMTKKEIEKPKVDAAHASIEEIDQLLEDDALALLNIKKEMMQVQKDELEKLRRTLTSVKKEYDNLRNSNSIIEKEISSLHDKYSSLVNVEQATTENEHILLDTSHVMNQQIDQVQEELAAEQSTIKMQQLLVKRLEIEISQCRVDTAKAEIALEHAKHDLGVAEGTLGVNRQELQEIETQYEKMFSTVKVRKEQREGKINMLHGMSVDGEESVQRLNSSLMESSKVYNYPIYITSTTKVALSADSELGVKGKRCFQLHEQQEVQRNSSVES